MDRTILLRDATHPTAVLASLKLVLVCLCALAAGCGTTKWSDSPRTATEQLLVSDSVDRAISEIDFSALADKAVYLDTRFIVTTLDQNYVVSTLRQHMLASGVVLKDKAEDCEYVVEVRTGSLGTNRQDLLFGVPATNLPTAGLLPVGSASIPEIALVKRTNQQAVCKIAAFAYERQSGRPVWQSGNRKVASRAKDIWVMGAGPFQKGTIYDGTAFAGERLSVPLVKSSKTVPEASSVALPRVYGPKGQEGEQRANAVENAGFNDPLPIKTAAAPANGAAPPAAAPATNAAGAPAADAPAPPPKPAYTPPPPVPAPVVPVPPPSGPQGNLAPQTIAPSANPAATTAGAIQTFNWAKDAWDRKQAAGQQ